MCSPICLSNCQLFRRDKTFYQRTTKIFNESESKLIMELFKCYMADGFIFWPLKLNFESFKTCLNNMHPPIKITFEKPEIIYENEKKVQVLNFLDAKIILHEVNSVETDIYYKPTNTHNSIVHTFIIPKITSSATQLKEL